MKIRINVNGCVAGSKTGASKKLDNSYDVTVDKAPKDNKALLDVLHQANIITEDYDEYYGSFSCASFYKRLDIKALKQDVEMFYNVESEDELINLKETMPEKYNLYLEICKIYTVEQPGKAKSSTKKSSDNSSSTRTPRGTFEERLERGTFSKYTATTVNGKKMIQFGLGKAHTSTPEALRKAVADGYYYNPEDLETIIAWLNKQDKAEDTVDKAEDTVDNEVNIAEDLPFDAI